MLYTARSHFSNVQEQGRGARTAQNLAASAGAVAMVD